MGSDNNRLFSSRAGILRGWEAFVTGDEYRKTLHLFEMDGGSVIAELEGHAGPPRDARFSPDGAWLVTNANDSKIILWDGRTGKLRHEYHCETARWSSLAFTADSRNFIAETDQGVMSVVDCETGESRIGFRVRPSQVTDMVAMPDKKHVIILTRGPGNEDSGKYSLDTKLECWPIKLGK